MLVASAFILMRCSLKSLKRSHSPSTTPLSISVQATSLAASKSRTIVAPSLPMPQHFLASAKRLPRQTPSCKAVKRNLPSSSGSLKLSCMGRARWSEGSGCGRSGRAHEQRATTTLPARTHTTTSTTTDAPVGARWTRAVRPQPLLCIFKKFVQKS